MTVYNAILLSTNSWVRESWFMNSDDRIHREFQYWNRYLPIIKKRPSLFCFRPSRVVPIQKKGPSQNVQKPPPGVVFQDLFLLYGIQYHFFEFLWFSLRIHKNSPNGTEFRMMIIRSEPGPFQGGHKPTGPCIVRNRTNFNCSTEVRCSQLGWPGSYL